MTRACRAADLTFSVLCLMDTRRVISLYLLHPVPPAAVLLFVQTRPTNVLLFVDVAGLVSTDTNTAGGVALCVAGTVKSPAPCRSCTAPTVRPHICRSFDPVARFCEGNATDHVNTRHVPLCRPVEDMYLYANPTLVAQLDGRRPPYYPVSTARGDYQDARRQL